MKVALFFIYDYFNKKIFMENNVIATAFQKELEAEYAATKKCLERIPESLFEYKPHPKSMKMGYLVELVSEIPLWVATMVNTSEIDFVTFPHKRPTTTGEVVALLDENMEAAKKALSGTTDEALQEAFSLKANGELLYTSPKMVEIGSALNHWVHHRGQLTVYMRLNDIAVPSIYGPSADDNNFKH